MSRDFSGPPLVAGTILGVRHWSVNADTFLLAPSFMTRWMNGENRAQHQDAWYDPDYWQHNGHRIAQENCQCGFYAYYDASGSSYKKEWRAEGIIEGYGLVSVGPLGFRAEKAKIIAVTLPRVYANGKPADMYAVKQVYHHTSFYDTTEEMYAAHPVTRPDFAPEPRKESDTFVGIPNMAGGWTLSSATSWFNQAFSGGGGGSGAVSQLNEALTTASETAGEAKTQAQKFEAAIKKPHPPPAWVQVSPATHRYIPRKGR